MRKCWILKYFSESIKSHIINTRHHLKEFNRHEGNVAIMDTGEAIPVARRKLSGFINAIKTF